VPDKSFDLRCSTQILREKGEMKEKKEKEKVIAAKFQSENHTPNREKSE
jgi:hypothetical protein